MGLFGNKKREQEDAANTEINTNNHGVEEHSNSPKTEGAGGGTVERLNQNSEELKRLLNEFRAMQGENFDPAEEETPENSSTEEYSDERHSVEEGEKYTLSEEENRQIEKYLVGEPEEDNDDEYDYVEEIIDDADEEEQGEVVEEVVEEEYVEEEAVDETHSENEDAEEEYIEEEIVDDAEEVEEEEEYLEEVVEDEIINADEDIIADKDEYEMVEDEQTEVDEIADEDEYEYEMVEDEQTEVDEIADEDEYEYEMVEDDEEVQTEERRVVSDEYIDQKLDAKFNAFEEQLLAKLMATINMSNANAQTVNQPSMTEEETPIEANEEDLNFEGQVVMFEPIENIKQVTWEDVVKRKGHCTYHVTVSSNGGWFIKRSKAPNPSAYVERKDEAMRLAIAYAKREKAELKIHNAKGVIEKSMSFGREKKIN